MRFIEIVIQDGMYKKKIEFSNYTNLIYSKHNSSGKSTFIRAILYAMGYHIPSTKGMKFKKMNFWLTIQHNKKEYKIHRHDSYLSLNDGKEKTEYSLPTDFNEVIEIITDCKNEDLIKNFLGAFYMDQEKGWTLLNRGKVIGNISFNIESFVRGLGGNGCPQKLAQLEAVNRQLKKYEYMHSITNYQEEINKAGENLYYNTVDEAIDREIELLHSKRIPILEEQKQIKDILRKNKLLVDYISDMKLIVKSDIGKEILVTKENLMGFMDNNYLLVARKEMLAIEIEKINREIEALEKKQKKEEDFIKVETIIEKFDTSISKIKVDELVINNIITRLKKEKIKLQKEIKIVTKTDNQDIVSELHDCISRYVKEMEIEKYVSESKDYIFTNDLQSLSGTILHKIVFAFKMAYINLIKDKVGLALPIILDSPSGKEVEKTTVEKMLKIIQRDFSEHQLIIASIYNYDIKIEKIIEFKGKLFDEEDMIKYNK